MTLLKNWNIIILALDVMINARMVFMLSEYVRVRLIEEMHSRKFTQFTKFARNLSLEEQWVRSKLMEPGREGKRDISLDDLSVFADKLKIPVCSLFPLEIGDVIRKMPIGEFLLSICKSEIEDQVRIEVEKYLKEHPPKTERKQTSRRAT